MGWMGDPGMEVAGRGQRVTLSSEMRRGSDIRLAFVPRVVLLVPTPAGWHPETWGPLPWG